MIICILLLTSLHTASGYVYAMPPSSTANLTEKRYRDREADFGPDIPEDSLRGRLFLAKPLNACSPVYPPQRRFSPEKVFLLIEEAISQDYCPYTLQVLNAQSAGYDAAIIYSHWLGGELLAMGGDGPLISAVYVTRTAGLDLRNYLSPTNSLIEISAVPQLPLQFYLIPFAVVVGICFFFMIAFSIGRYCRYRVRQRRARLSPANLKKIPTKKFKKGDEYDICAICIEEYEENEKIRILPCNHAYHCKCVDPWLTSGKKLCPVCKQSAEPEKKKKKTKRNKRKQDLEPFDGANTSSQQTDRTVTDNSETEEPSSDECTPLLSSTQEMRSSGAIHV